MLYGRQEIRVLTRDHMASLQQIGYATAFGVLCCFCEQSRTFGSCVFTHRNLLLFIKEPTQIAWVLYGQASRAISIG